MAEPNPPRPHPGTTNPPVPDSAPMPTKAGRNMGVVATAIVAVLLALGLVVVDTAGGLDGWARLVYLLPALLFAGAGSVRLREAATSGRR